MTIECLYSCADCGLRERPVTVPARTTEDVVEWMRGIVIPAIQADHKAVSPGCQARAIAQLKIPMQAGVDRVGGATAQ